MCIFEETGQMQSQGHARAVPAGYELASGLMCNVRGRAVGVGREGSVTRFTLRF